MAVLRGTAAGSVWQEWLEWLENGREWIVARVGPPGSWLRREPLPSRPLIVIAAAVAAGVWAARMAQMPGAAPMAAAVWWCAGAALLGAWWRWMRCGVWHLAGAAILLSVACVAAAWSIAQWSLFPSADIAWGLSDVPTPIALEGIVVEPSRLRGDGSPSSRLAGPMLPPTSECTVAVRRVRDDDSWRVAGGTAAVHVTGTSPDLVPGDRVIVFGRGLRPTPALNPGDADPRDQARAARCLSVIRVRDADGIRVVGRAAGWAVRATIERIRRKAIAVLRACISPERAGLAGALLLGGRESLPREDARHYVVTGTVHILSISGLHVGLLAYAVCRLLQMLPIRRGWLLLAAALITGAYAVLVGAETPVVRATVVTWLACLAANAGRRSQGMTALAAAAIVVLAWQPAELFRAGGQLSFLSTAVLVIVADLLDRRVDQDDPIARLVERSRSPLERRLRRIGIEAIHLTIAGAAVWGVTAPLVAARFHVVSPVAVVLNPLIAPFVAVAMAWGFLCLVAELVWHPLALGCGWMCDATLASMGAIVEAAADMPAAYAWVVAPPMWWVAGWYCLLAAAVLGLARERLRQPSTWAAVATAWMLVGLAGGIVSAMVVPSAGELRAVVASMGHGCGIVVRSPAGRCLVYDAGRLGAPGAAQRAMAGVLWAEGIRRIDTLVISHADADHFNAVPDLIERFTIGELVVSEAFLRRDTAAVGELLLLARQSRIPVRTVTAGDSFALDPQCRVSVLHPSRPSSGGAWRGSDNEASIVMAIESAGRSLLFTGDIEGDALRSFVAADPDSCDVLVAPHHGSGTSLPPDIARATAAEMVIVSGVGGNRWDEVSRAYATARGADRPATVLKTGGAGAIAVALAAGGMEVSRFSHGGWHAVSHGGPR